MYLTNNEEYETQHEQEKEIQRKLTFEIEWYYEQHGEIICIEDLVFYTEREMKDEESWTEEAFEYMEEIAEDILEQEAGGLESQIRNMEPQDPNAGQTFYDRQL